MRGSFEGGKVRQGSFSGRINGGATVSGRVTPSPQGPAIQITSADAGAAVKSVGILPSASGGVLQIDLQPTGAAGTYDGRLAISDISVYQAPVMAEILSGLSIVGMLEQMAGEGIKFAEVDADFRLDPEQLVLRSSSAVGASMGLSLGGYYALSSQQLNMQGVFSPLYIINAVGQILTRKGEGLFGMTFTVKGTTAAPSVSVNPLTLLAPGPLREIFRSRPPQAGQ
nr:AsmA-like C-terminal region-containing protein [Pseudooceanicola algae]